MKEFSRRHVALNMAYNINSALGVTCPGCLIATAKEIDEFLRTGDVASPTHLTELPDLDIVTDEDLGDNVVSLDPKKTH